MKEKQTYQFKTEIEQLLDLLANALYTNKDFLIKLDKSKIEGITYRFQICQS